MIVCPLVIFKDPSRHLRSWRSRALSARARTAPDGRMDSVSHGSGGIDPPPEYRSSYSRLPILLSPAPSKHQLQEYRSTVLQVLEAAGLRPLVERRDVHQRPPRVSRTAHPISMPSTPSSSPQPTAASLPRTLRRGGRPGHSRCTNRNKWMLNLSSSWPTRKAYSRAWSPRPWRRTRQDCYKSFAPRTLSSNPSRMPPPEHSPHGTST